jgi:hypothetical protein
MHDDAAKVGDERVEAREAAIRERLSLGDSSNTGGNNGDNGANNDDNDNGGTNANVNVLNSELYLGRSVDELRRGHEKFTGVGGDNDSNSGPLNGNLLLDKFRHPHMLQCWFNPGMHLGTLQEDSKARIYQPEEFPILRVNNQSNNNSPVGNIEKLNADANESAASTNSSTRPLFARLLMGEYGEKKSPVESWNARLLLLDCYVNNNGPNVNESRTTNNETNNGYDYYLFDGIPQDYTNVWVYVCTDNGKIEGGEVANESNGAEVVGVCLLPGEDGSNSADLNFPELQFQLVNKHEIGVCNGVEFPESGSATTRLAIRVKQSSSDSKPSHFPTTHFLIGAGKPFNEKWVKLLGNDGALLGPDEEYVRAKMAEFEKDPDGFGK